MRESHADRYLGAKMERERIENKNRRAAWLDWFKRYGARSGSFRVDCSEACPIIVQVAPLPEGTPPPPETLFRANPGAK